MKTSHNKKTIDKSAISGVLGRSIDSKKIYFLNFLLLTGYPGWKTGWKTKKLFITERIEEEIDEVVVWLRFSLHESKNIELFEKGRYKVVTLSTKFDYFQDW